MALKHFKRAIAVILSFVGILALASASDDTIMHILVPGAIMVASWTMAGLLLRNDDLEEYE